MADIYNYEANGAAQTKTDIERVGVCVPMDIQNHFTQSIVALNAVALTIAGGATPASTSSSIACDGFNEISVNTFSSVAHSGYFTVYWSYDNSTFNIAETPSGDKIQNNGTSGSRFATIPVRAPYFKLTFTNADATNAPTVTAWAYPKA